jgi:transcriptional regulator with XRE-family HTH domain
LATHTRTTLGDTEVIVHGLTLPAAVRPALAQRNAVALFQAIVRAAVDHEVLARLTGMSPSEVLDVLAGQQVCHIGALESICDGLGLDRAAMRLGPAADDFTIWDEPVPVPMLVVRQETVTLEVVRWLRPACSHAEQGFVSSPGSGTPGGVPRWGAAEVGLLRTAMELDRPTFAKRLGVAERSVTSWERGSVPRLHSQDALDAALRLAPPQVRARFFKMAGEAPNIEVKPQQSFGWIVGVQVVSEDRQQVALAAGAMGRHLARTFPDIGHVVMHRRADWFTCSAGGGEPALDDAHTSWLSSSEEVAGRSVAPYGRSGAL